jgi:hypothetical protein
MVDQHLRGRGECVVATVSFLRPIRQPSGLMLIVNHDDYVSRWRNTNFMREEALSQII